MTSNPPNFQVANSFLNTNTADREKHPSFMSNFRPLFLTICLFANLSGGAVAFSAEEQPQPPKAERSFKNIKDLSGKLLLDGSVETTGVHQFDKYADFIGVSSPTATPKTNHAYLWLNNGTKQLCTKFDNGSQSCISVTSNTVAGVGAGLGINVSGITTYTVGLSTPVDNASLDSSSITKQGNTFNTAGKLAKLDNGSNLSVPKGIVASTYTAGSGSSGSPAYAFTASTATGMYYDVNGGTNTYAFVLNGRIVGYWQLQNGTDGSHNNPEGYRPIFWIGPGIISSTYTQLGEGLNVWGNTDGGGGQPQIDIVVQNIGRGDARLLAQASMADTPNTVIGYLSAYGLGHINDPFYTGGPQRAGAVALEFQAPRNNVFNITTASNTWFYNQNTTHAAYHFAHGTSPSADDITFVDNQISFSSGGGIVGTTTNDAAGSSTFVGYSTSAYTPTAGKAFPASGTWGDLTSVTVPSGGDYMCSAHLVADGTGGTGFRLGITTTSGNSTTGMIDGDNRLYGGSTASADQTLTLANYRISVTASTTVYLKYFSTYTGTETAWGRITCIRIR